MPNPPMADGACRKVFMRGDARACQTTVPICDMRGGQGAVAGGGRLPRGPCAGGRCRLACREDSRFRSFRGAVATTAAIFDSYAAAKRLRDAGFDEGQAEAAVAVIRDAVTEGVATKTDVARLETLIERGVNRLLLAMFAVGGLVVAAIKLLP